MSLNDWYSGLESKIYTYIKTKLKDNKAVSVSCDENSTNLKFPCVLVKEADGYEQGADLEGSTINALMYTIQITVTSNVSKSEATKIMASVIPHMKSLRFYMVSMPIVLQDANKYYSVARFRRLVGSGDTDLVK